jgi:hypothetical protein
MTEFVWGYSLVLWYFFNDRRGAWLLLPTSTRFQIFFTFKVHLLFFIISIVLLSNFSTLYFQKKLFKFFNNYWMSNLTHIMVFRFSSKIIYVFPKKGDMQNSSYQLLSNAFCGLWSEWSQKTHMTSNWKCIWNYVLQQNYECCFELGMKTKSPKQETIQS